MSSDRPQFHAKNALAYPVGLGMGVYGSLHLMTGFEYGITGMPLQVTGWVTLGYSVLYALNPILYDFGPAIRRMERRGRKTFLTAKGERTITVGGSVQASSLQRLARKQRRHQMALQVQQSQTVVATRDVVFYHNQKAIPGKVYYDWLKRGYALQLQWQEKGARRSGLSKSQRGDLPERYWGRLYDVLHYTVQSYIEERGIVLAETHRQSYLLRCKPKVIYDCSCMLLV